MKLKVSLWNRYSNVECNLFSVQEYLSSVRREKQGECNEISLNVWSRITAVKCRGDNNKSSCSLAFHALDAMEH